VCTRADPDGHERTTEDLAIAMLDNRTPPPSTGPSEVPPADRLPMTAARELLARTAELPGSKRELLEVLTEYRNVLFACAIEGQP
jgi:hypothetical protein